MLRKTVLSILLLILFLSCTAPVAETPDYYIMHHQYGGWVYMSRKIEVFGNRDIIIIDNTHSIKSKISDNDYLGIYSKIIENNFLGLDSIYATGVCCDAYIYRTTYACEGDTHSVLTTECEMWGALGSWKKQFMNIADYIMDYSYTIGQSIDTGLVKITFEHPLFEWPYSNEVRLSENIESHVNVEHEVITYVEEIRAEYRHSLFIENDIIYSVSCNDSSIHIIYPSTGTKWPFPVDLSDIDENGYLIYGENFTWLQNTLENMPYYPRWFYDSKSDSSSAYQINLIQGNYF